MSQKRIQPIQATACYYSIDPDRDAADKIRFFFSKLFRNFQPHSAIGLLATCRAEDGDEPTVVVLDLRGDFTHFETFLSAYRDLHRALSSRIVVAICEADGMAKVTEMAAEGFLPQHLLSVPWKHGVLERVIEDIRSHIAQVELPSSSQEIVLKQLNKGGNREYVAKLHAANSFYAHHARMMQDESGRMLRLVKSITQEEASQEIPALGRLIQYAEVLDKEVGELVEFATQNWDTYQYRSTFDINTVLETVSSTSVPLLKEHGIELIFEVNNNIPARLIGYALGMINALVTVLELIAHAKIQGELIMRLSLHEDSKSQEATLNVQFLQAHYRGSVTNVILSAIRKDHQFSRLLEEMDAIDGSVLHAKSESRGDILQLGFKVQTLERRSYRLPSRDIMDKTVMIVDDRKKNAEILQKMLQYFHLNSTVVAQLDEAMMRIGDHEFDVVIVTESLARRCAKNCKKAQAHEKFIVINNDKGVNNAYLGLDLANSFLNEPFTHKGIFKAIVDVFSDESVEGRMEDLATLKSYLGLLAKNRRMIYLGNSAATARGISVLLEGTGMKLEGVRHPQKASAGAGGYDFVLVGVDLEVLKKEPATIEAYLTLGKNLSKHGRIVCVVPEEVNADELDAIAEFDFVVTYLHEPIDPETFYKVLLDCALGE